MLFFFEGGWGGHARFSYELLSMCDILSLIHYYLAVDFKKDEFLEITVAHLLVYNQSLSWQDIAIGCIIFKLQLRHHNIIRGSYLPEIE